MLPMLERRAQLYLPQSEDASIKKAWGGYDSLFVPDASRFEAWLRPSMLFVVHPGWHQYMNPGRPVTDTYGRYTARVREEIRKAKIQGSRVLVWTPLDRRRVTLDTIGVKPYDTDVALLPNLVEHDVEIAASFIGTRHWLDVWRSIVKVVAYAQVCGEYLCPTKLYWGCARDVYESASTHITEVSLIDDAIYDPYRDGNESTAIPPDLW